MPTLTQAQVVQTTAGEVRWWINERLNKFRQLDHDTMAINPFMAPVLMALHSHMTFGELGELLLDGHFMGGHATGFGKLVDEKLMAKLFGSTKLTGPFRAKNPPYNEPHFSDVDHVIGVGRPDQILMSIKASRWTIQLGQAQSINHAFTNLLRMRAAGETNFSKIIVGVFYGKLEDLTDKFDIIRGICSGARHHVTDIRDQVEVVAGREFWAMMNGGELATQQWIMEGVLAGVSAAAPELKDAKKLLEGYKSSFEDMLKHHVGTGGAIDWIGLLKEING